MAIDGKSRCPCSGSGQRTAASQPSTHHTVQPVAPSTHPTHFGLPPLPHMSLYALCMPLLRYKHPTTPWPTPTSRSPRLSSLRCTPGSPAAPGRGGKGSRVCVVGGGDLCAWATLGVWVGAWVGQMVASRDLWMRRGGRVGWGELGWMWDELGWVGVGKKGSPTATGRGGKQSGVGGWSVNFVLGGGGWLGDGWVGGG